MKVAIIISAIVVGIAYNIATSTKGAVEAVVEPAKTAQADALAEARRALGH